MVDIKAKSVLGYLLELAAGLAIIVGVLMLVSSVYRGDLFGILLAVVLTVGGILVFKRPGRSGAR
ncbi:hypothetical protein AB0J83_39580 [Actinoplanes sp. NPDC049596]|uniref:hypothetical protein n=1 Tax=unclassified Actinoplanes TaxID=2626549 RepID=UPI003440E2F3